MGNRKFYDQLIADMCQHEKDSITDEIDVTTMKDYMQVCRVFSSNTKAFHTSSDWSVNVSRLFWKIYTQYLYSRPS